MAEVDNLSIKISAEASKANASLETLITKLDKLSLSLSSIQGTSLAQFANSLSQLGVSVQTISAIDSRKFKTIANNINKLGDLNVSNLGNAINSINSMSTALNGLSGLNTATTNISNLATSISKLSGKRVDTAIAKMPQLATAVTKLMTTLSKAPQVSNNVIQLTNAMANLASQGSRVGAAANSISQIQKSSTKASKSVGSLASTFGMLYANFFWAKRGLDGITSSIEKTADYFEAFNYYTVSLRKIASEWDEDWDSYADQNAQTYSNKFITTLNDTLSKMSGVQIDLDTGTLNSTNMKNLGLNIQEVTQAMAQLSSVTNSVGQTGDVSLATADAFSKLASDMSSLFNVDYSDVMSNLQSGLLGQSRAMYKYGVDITNNTLQMYAFELGLEKAVSEMTQAEKQQLRIIAILDQSRVSWGDQANTINSLANQMRLLENNMSEVSLVFGQLFVPMVEKALPVVNGLTIALKNLLTNIATLLGIEIDVNSFNQGTSGLDEDLEDITDSTEDATEALKEYKNQLLGFDEVNKLSDTSATATLETESSGIDLTDEIIAATGEYNKFWNEAFANMENNADKWAEIFEDMFDPFESIIANFNSGNWFGAGKDIAGLATQLQSFITESIEEVDWKDVGSDVGEFLEGAILESFETFGDSGKTITTLATSIFDFATSAIDEIDWEDVGESLLDNIGQFFRELDIGKIMGKISDFGESLVDAIFGVISGFFSDPQKVGEVIWDILDFMTELGGGIFSSIMNNTGNLLENIIGLFNGGNAPEIEEEIDFTVKISPTVQEAIDKADELQKKHDELQLELAEELELATADTSTLELLIEKYQDIASQAELTAEDIATLDGLKNTIIEQGGVDFKKVFDDETLSIEAQGDALKNLVDDLKKMSLQKAYSNMASDVGEQMVAVQGEMARLQADWLKKESETAHSKEARATAQSTIDALKSQYNALAVTYGRLDDELDLYLRASADAVAMDKLQSELVAIKSGKYDYHADVLKEAIGETKKITTETSKQNEETSKNIEWIQKAGATVGSYNDICNRGLTTQKEVNESIHEGGIAIQTTAGTFDTGAYGIESAFGRIHHTGINSIGGLTAELPTIATETEKTSTRMGNAASGINISFSKASSLITANLKKIPTSISDEVPDTEKAMSKLAGGITGKIAEVNTSIINQSSKTKYSSIGTNILAGIKSGLDDKEEQNKVLSSISSIGTSIANKFKSIMGIHSPSKVFEEFGQFTVEGYNIGLGETFSDTYLLIGNWGEKLKGYTKVSLEDVTKDFGMPTIQKTYQSNSKYETTLNNQEEIALLRQQNQLLQALLNKEETVISPNADGIFNLVRNKAISYTQSTGDLAFPV